MLQWEPENPVGQGDVLPGPASGSADKGAHSAEHLPNPSEPGPPPGTVTVDGSPAPSWYLGNNQVCFAHES